MVLNRQDKLTTNSQVAGVGFNKLKNIVSAKAFAVLTMVAANQAMAKGPTPVDVKRIDSNASVELTLDKLPDTVKFEAELMFKSSQKLVTSTLGSPNGTYLISKNASNNVDIFKDGVKLFEYTSTGLKKYQNNKESFFSNGLKSSFLGNDVVGNFQPSASGVSTGLSYGNENFSIDLGLEQILANSNETRVKTSVAFLYAGKKMGTAVHIQKSSKLGQFLVTQGFNLNSHSVKLTAGLLEKVMDFSYSLESNQNSSSTKDFNDVKIKQKVLAGEYKYRLSNDYLKEINTSIVFFDVDGKKLGKIEDIVKNNPSFYEWSEKTGYYQGGSKLIYQAGLAFRLNDQIKVEPTLGFEKNTFKSIDKIDGYTDKSLTYGVKSTYQPTTKDKVELEYMDTSNYKKVGVTYSHKFEGGIEGYVQGSHTNYRDMKDNSEVGIGIRYAFGGNSKSYEPLFRNELNKNDLYLSDLTPISRAASENIEAGKQTFYTERIAYVDKTALNPLDEIVQTPNGAEIYLDNNGFEVFSVRNVSDSSYSSFFTVKSGKLAVVNMKGIIAQMNKEGLKKGQVKNLRVSVNDAGGISVYELNIESGSVVIKSKIERINEVTSDLEKDFLDNKLSAEEVKDEVEKLKDKTAPIAVGETFTVDYGTSLNGINVLANDSDDSGIVILGNLSSSVGGTFTKSGNLINFTPNSGFSGNASIDYQVLDKNGNVSIAKLVIVVKSAPANVPGTIDSPSLESKTSTSVDVAAGSVVGMTNVRVELYSDAGLTTKVGESVDGVFSGLTSNTTYYAVTVGDDVNESTSVVETKRSSVLSVTTDSPANVPGTIDSPSLESKTSTSVDVAAGSVVGMTNVRVELYSDAGLTTKVGESVDGVFSGLTSNTTYYAVTVGDDVNESTSVVETKRSSALSVTTDSPANVPGTIDSPSLESKTSTSVDVAAGSVVGMTNVRVELYSDAGLTTKVGESVDGVFSGLTSNTTYYAVTVGDDVNESTSVVETKRSSALSVTTDSPANVPGTIDSPSLESKTSTSVDVAAGSVVGMTNVRVELYSDAGLTTKVGESVDGVFSGLTSNTTYYAVTVGDDVNESTSVVETKRSSVLSVTTDSPANVPGTIDSPSLESKTSTSVDVAAGSVVGMTNVRVELYSDAGLTTKVGESVDGVFSGLTSNTTYYAVTVGDDVNESTSVVETKRSSALSVTTDSPANVPGTIDSPSLESKTSTSVDVAAGSVVGMTNVRVELYSDAGLTTKVGESVDGVFSGLTSNTTYYAVTVGDDVNESTSVVETKRSSALSVTTDSPANVPGTIDSPSLESKTSTSVDVAAGSVVGMTNVRVELYSDAGLTTKVGESVDGVFSGLTSNTTYYAVTVGDDVNESTSVVETKRSSALSVTTLNNTTPTIIQTPHFGLLAGETVNKVFTVNHSEGGLLDLNIETTDVKITITNAGGGNVLYIKDGNFGNGTKLSITGVPAGTTIEYTVTDMLTDNSNDQMDQIEIEATDNGGEKNKVTTNINFI